MMNKLALAVVPALIVACSAVATPSPSPTPLPTRIEVRLTDELKIEPVKMTVPAGTPVTFVVTNVGAAEHEFFIGDENAQAMHEQEMRDMGGMTHDEADGIVLAGGETKELTHTFTQAGETLGGCHSAGHYAAGMKATITVVG
jgi:uncharacterized cupredoxin-like copper-binding protein